MSNTTTQSPASKLLRSLREDLVTNPTSSRIEFARKLAVETARASTKHTEKTQIYCILAQHFHNYAEFDEAYAWLDKARSAAGTDPNAIAWVAYIHASILMRERRNREAMNLLVQHEKELKDLNTPIHARILTLKAGLLDSLGEVDVADATFKRAIELREALNDPLGLATVYYNYGEFCMRRDDDVRALEYFERTYEIEQKLKNFSGLAQTSCHLAQLYAKQGNAERSLHFYNEAKQWASESGVPLVIALVKSNAASIFEHLGNETEHLTSLLDAKTYLDRHPFPAIRGNVLGNLGKLYTNNGRFAEAEALLREALSIAESEEYVYGQGYWLYLLGLLYNKQERFAEAIPLLTQARDLLASVQAHVYTLQAFSELAKAQAGVGATAEAYALMSEWATEYIRHHTSDVESRIQRVQRVREEELKEREQEIYRLKNVELSAANDKLKQANKELLDLAAEKDEFMAIAAHDLRNPLSDMRTMLQSVIANYDALSNEDIIDVCRELLNTVTRMGSTIHAFLEISRTDKKSRTLNIDRLELIHTIHRAVERHSARAAAKNIDFAVQGPPQLWALGDPSIVDAVLDNLISNAVKFSPHGGHITIAAGTHATPPDGISCSPDHVVIAVIDSGSGIPEHEQPLLFSKYARLSSLPTAGEESMGLGLYLSHRLAERMQASLRYVNNPSNGATFVFELPAAP